MKEKLKKKISKSSDKLAKMLEEKKPYDEILKHSESLDKLINEYYNKKEC